MKVLGLSSHANEALDGMARFYHVPRRMLLRVIAESYLDAASEDGDMQQELAAAATSCRRFGYVPNCWLDLEASDADNEGDDDDVTPEDRYAMAGWSCTPAQRQMIIAFAMQQHLNRAKADSLCRTHFKLPSVKALNATQAATFIEILQARRDQVMGLKFKRGTGEWD